MTQTPSSPSQPQASTETVAKPTFLASLSRLRPGGFFYRFRGVFALSLAIFFALLMALVIFRFSRPPLSSEAMDYAQIARNIAGGRGFTTSVLLPFALPLSQGRSSFAELQHEPIFPLLTAVAFVVTSPSDTILIVLSLAFFVLSAALLFSLAVRLTQGNFGIAFLTTALYVLSAPVHSQAASGTPVTLSTALLLALLLVLTPRPGTTETNEKEVDNSSKPKKSKLRRAQIGLLRRYFWAGVLLGLCYLTSYISLFYGLALVLIWVGNQDGWNRNTLRRFAFGFILVSSPWWVRNFRLTGNPFYTLQWFELAMQTRAFPGQSLLRDFEQGSNGTLLSLGPGLGELLRKFFRGVQAYFNLLPQVPHPYLMPFVVLAYGMHSRFVTAEKCRVKTGLAVALLILIVASSLLGRSDTRFLQPLIPLLCFVGITSLIELFGLWQEYWLKAQKEENRVARNRSSMVSFSRMRALVIVGLVALLFFPLAPLASAVISRRAINNSLSARAQAFKQMGEALPAKRAIVTDQPWEVAWYSKRPAVWLPSLPDQLSKVNQQQPLGSLFLSSQVASRTESASLEKWQRIYRGEDPLTGYSKSVVSREGDILFLKNPTLTEATNDARKKPRDVMALLTLGYAQLVANRPGPARATFVAAQRIGPKNSQPFLGGGESALKSGDFDRALGDFKRALALAPRSLSAQMGIADAQLAKGQNALAQVSYERVLADYPNHLIAVNNLAYLYAEAGKDLDRALHMARRAAEMNRNNPEVLDTLGWVCSRTGRHEEAVAYLGQAVQLAPQKGLTRYHFGKALLGAGKREDGYATLQKALEMSLPASQANDARRIIASR
jgi:tetratricopeptide (TPR) repeat protein